MDEYKELSEIPEDQMWRKEDSRFGSSDKEILEGINRENRMQHEYFEELRLSQEAYLKEVKEYEARGELHPNQIRMMKEEIAKYKLTSILDLRIIPDTQEDQRRWTADQESRQRTQEQQRYHAAQRVQQINQTLEFRAMPNKFVPLFQNGL